MAEEQDKSSDTPQPKKSKGLPVIAIVAIGCVGLLIVSGIALTIAGKVLFSKVGLGLIQKGIESKTGMKVDTKEGRMTLKDAKTGSEVNVGEGKIPEGFPTDFPIYPGAKATGSLSGSEKEKGKGFWLVFSSADAVEKVAAFYDEKLKSSGWETGKSLNYGAVRSWEVKKGDLAGNVTVTEGDNKKGAAIMVTLGPAEKVTETPASGAGATEVPTDTQTPDTTSQ